MNAPVSKKTLSEAASGLRVKLKAVKCPNCGGSISINGGHNVKTIVCQYCGSILDAKNDLAILRSTSDSRLKRIYPLSIGMKGNIRGVNFIVIGITAYEQKEEGQTYRWVEYFLFSYTHGYAYLNCEKDHWLLLHETKDLPEAEFKMSAPVKSTFEACGKSFTVFESGRARITYAVGEFTWEITEGDVSSFLDAICPPYMYSLEKRQSEIEYFLGEYIQADEIKQGFALSNIENPKGVGACQPMKNKVFFTSLALASFISALISLFCYFGISTRGKCIFVQKFNKELMDSGSTTTKFFAKKGVPYAVNVAASGLNNSWYYVEARVLDADEQNEFCTFSNELSFYSGSDWSENNSSAYNFINFDEDGYYKIDFEGEGGFGETELCSSSYSHDKLTFAIYEGIREGDYTLVWLFIESAIGILACLRYSTFERIRWGAEYDD